MGFITEYLEMQKKYQEEYGERTVVFAEVGSFYECYEYNIEYCTSEEAKYEKLEGKNRRYWDKSIGHAIELSVILNCHLTYQDSTIPYGISSPHKIGFPTIVWEKNKSTLLSNDYLVIRVDQKKVKQMGKNLLENIVIERHVAEVCSPTMQIDGNLLNNNVVSLYIEYQGGNVKNYENFLITTGTAVIDITNGSNKICEFHSKKEDQISALQEIYRFLISHYPREIIIHISDLPKELDIPHNSEFTNPYVKYLESVLELNRFGRLTVFINKIPSEYKKISYQTDFFNKLFSSNISDNIFQHAEKDVIRKINNNIISDFELELLNYGRIAYISLMKHCYNHNVNIISKLSKPDSQWIDEKSHLILTHNAIVQLDLISTKRKKKKEIDSLMSVLDHNKTNLGRIMLQNLLQNPMLDVTKINDHYDMISEMSTCIFDEKLWTFIDKSFKELPNIGHLHRKLEIKLITPRELAFLYGAYIKIKVLCDEIYKIKTSTIHKYLLKNEDYIKFCDFICHFSKVIDFSRLECCNLEKFTESNVRYLDFKFCPIKKGNFSDMDKKTSELEKYEYELEKIVDHLNKFVSKKGRKLEYKSSKKKQGAKKQNPEEQIIVTTNAKANTLRNCSYDRNLCGEISISPHTTSEKMIKSDIIKNLCFSIHEVKMWLREKLFSVYESILDEMNYNYNFYKNLDFSVGKLDLIHSYAKASNDYEYYRPTIINDESDSSYLEAKEIRHPIIERIIGGEYITNDVSLGKEYEDGSVGMLLFGLNMAGKTSMAKATALNIIMAQIGCYTPSKLRYKPYTKIITRLSCNDNIFQGQSSFAVEMKELRTILRQSDSRTLVVGDEISRGTESNSATGITASAILHLINTKTSFVFASHVHNLVDLPHISELSSQKLSINHLSVIRDSKSGELVYERKLVPGSGPSTYGILVAEALNLPKSFIDKAYEITNYYTSQNEIITPKTPKYNSEVYVHECSACKKRKDLHTHHIIEQRKANDTGIIKTEILLDNGKRITNGIMHKNCKDNLIILCQSCHTKLHANHQQLETLTLANGILVRLKS